MDTTFDRYDRQGANAPTTFAQDETRDSAARQAAPRTNDPVAYAECGAGWYHDAAIKADKDRVGHPYRWPN